MIRSWWRAEDFGVVQIVGCVGMMASLPVGLLLLGAGLWTHFEDPRLLPYVGAWGALMGVSELVALGGKFVKGIVLAMAIGVPIVLLEAVALRALGI